MQLYSLDFFTTVCCPVCLSNAHFEVNYVDYVESTVENIGPYHNRFSLYAKIARVKNVIVVIPAAAAPPPPLVLANEGTGEAVPRLALLSGLTEVVGRACLKNSWLLRPVHISTKHFLSCNKLSQTKCHKQSDTCFRLSL